MNDPNPFEAPTLVTTSTPPKNYTGEIMLVFAIAVAAPILWNIFVPDTQSINQHFEIRELNETDSPTSLTPTNPETPNPETR